MFIPFVLYSGFLQSITEIYKENGLSGYFAGLMPRLIGNAVTLIIVSSSTYAINKYIITDREMKSFTAATTSVSSIMIISKRLVLLINIYFMSKMYNLSEKNIKKRF